MVEKVGISTGQVHSFIDLQVLMCLPGTRLCSRPQGDVSEQNRTKIPLFREARWEKHSKQSGWKAHTHRFSVHEFSQLQIANSKNNCGLECNLVVEYA